MSEIKTIDIIVPNFIEKAIQAVFKYLACSTDVADVDVESIKKIMILLVCKTSRSYLLHFL